ncbi:alpha/beta hydrolase [Zhouia amylolytica]|uniref:Esterase n=1 Tax=Zhouia amylolytica AD3 TaxID=1286632 RepID=W2UT01_9FLAO|nr:alpha/beta hydrolase-fold protein [Zhouia amylolytica]ETN96621.1 hypothetical protein P278_00470 [Zhouia amylolytica AD3]
MKKQIWKTIWLFSFIIGTFSLNGCTKEELLSQIQHESFSMISEYTKTKYRINIMYPERFNTENNYHTIFLLDGDDYFNEAANVIARLSKEKIVLVGIGYADKNQRGTDYSFPEDKDFPGDSGGALAFLKFLNNELIPWVEINMGIHSSDKTLFGHSLGGYFALFTLFQQNQTNPFDNIIAGSSNLMWYNAYLFDLEQDYYNAFKGLEIRLFLAVGDLEGASLNLFHDAFVEKLRSRSYSGFSLNFERLKNTSHRNSPIVTFENSVSILF